MKKNKIFLLILTFMALNINLPANSFMTKTYYQQEGLRMIDDIALFFANLTQGPKGIFSHIAENNLEKVKLFIEKNKNNQKKINLINDVNERYILKEICYEQYLDRFVKLTPLLFAINRKMEKIALLFLSAEAIDVNIPDNLQSTPLHKACFHKQLSVVRKLLEKGANINAKDSNGDTPLICCLYCIQDQEISASDIENILKIIKLSILNLATISDKTIELANELRAKYPKVLEYLTIIKEYVMANSDKKVNDSQIKFINKIEAEKKDEFWSLLQFFLYRSIIEIEESHKPQILEICKENRKPELQETCKCRSFESTDFYKYCITNKNKENIEHVLLLSGQNTGNLQEFALKDAEKNGLYYNKRLWTKFATGSKMLGNTKYSDCRIKCEN